MQAFGIAPAVSQSDAQPVGGFGVDGIEKAVQAVENIRYPTNKLICSVTASNLKIEIRLLLKLIVWGWIT